MTLTRKWSLLAAVLVVAIFAAGWFLLISPKRSEASDLQTQSQTVADANARLVQQLEVLKAQQAELPAQRAQLATFRKQIPDNPALPALIRDLTAAGRKVGVVIDELAPQVPVAMVTAAPATPTASATTTEPAAGSETAAESGGTAAASTTPAAPVAAPATQLYQVPLTVTVLGSYFELEQYVNRLEQFKRSFRVVGFSLAAEPENKASGEPILALSLQGQVFMSPPVAAAAPSTPVVPAPAGQ